MIAKKKLFLIGAGDFGREMESWLELLPDFHREWEIQGFLDNKPDALKDFPSEYRVIGAPLDYPFSPDDFVLICITNSTYKRDISLSLKGRVNFYSYIAPNTILGKAVKISEGVIIAPNCLVSTNVKIGEFVTINCGTNIGHDCVIGSYSSIMPSCDLGGHVVLGENVFIGTNSTVIPQKTVIDNSLIGAGSIVIRNIKKEGTYIGNPAKRFKF